MNIDALTEELETVLERARGALAQEISTARATLRKVQGEIADAGKALADLHDQRKLAESQLTAVTNDLQRASGLVGCGHNITLAKAELKKLNTEKAALEASVAVLTKQRADGEARLLALQNETQALVQVRSQSEAVMADLRMKLRQVQIGQQS